MHHVGVLGRRSKHLWVSLFLEVAHETVRRSTRDQAPTKEAKAEIHFASTISSTSSAAGRAIPNRVIKCMRSFSASSLSVPIQPVDQATQALQVLGPRTQHARHCDDGRFRQCRPDQSCWVEDLAEGHIQGSTRRCPTTGTGR